MLVQFINNQRDLKHPLKEALLRAGVMRLRPVLLTTGTTVLALFPTIYGFGGKDYMVAPLALSFGYGLIFATFITLVLIPTFYHIAEDFKGIAARLLSLLGIKMNPAIYEGAIEAVIPEVAAGPVNLVAGEIEESEGVVEEVKTSAKKESGAGKIKTASKKKSGRKKSS